MSAPSRQEPAPRISKVRAEALIDGIFAFSMTLLVASMIFPNALGGSANAPGLPELLRNIAPDLIYYVVSFMILSNYWLLSNQLHEYLPVGVDMTSIRMILVSLIFVALMPVSTVIAAAYGGNPYADIVLEVNLFAIGLLFSVHWQHIVRNPETSDHPVSPLQGCIAIRRNLVTPVVSVAAIVIALAGIPWSVVLLAFAPALEILVKRSCR